MPTEFPATPAQVVVWAFQIGCWLRLWIVGRAPYRLVAKVLENIRRGLLGEDPISGYWEPSGLSKELAQVGLASGEDEAAEQAAE